jgi:glycosyltransferase involved in cell wall biosynthesis
MWNGKSVSVVVPAYNEEATVREIIEELFRETPADEVIVVDNNSTDRTAEEVGKTRARILTEERQGYGFALRKGLENATGNYVVLFDADGNFAAEDIRKLLEYTDHFDLVKGTRSRPELVEEGVYSPVLLWLVIVANVIVSKFQQFLFRRAVLTDAGCTLRLFKRDLVRNLLPFVTVGGAHFLVDVTNLAMIANAKIIEVPVRFTKRRGGYSKHGAFYGLAKIAVNMTLHTIKQRLFSWGGRYREMQAAGSEAATDREVARTTASGRD